MKTVFTDISTIAHMWANKLQESARNSGNFYFNGDTIYSYGSHFPIAKHVENNEGLPAVLFTERKYSNTTAKHIQMVRSSARHLNIIYCSNPFNTHTDNFNVWTKKAESIAENLLKAKKPEIYLSQLSDITGIVNKYADFFSLQIPITLKTVLSIGDKSQFSEYQTRKVKLEKEAEKTRQKELSAKHKKEVNKWLKGETNRIYSHSGFDLLRLNENRIETSQAVKIPLEIGRRIYESIKDNSIAVGSKIMDFTVNETGKIVKVGCHTFKTDYLLKFGAQIFN